MILDTTCPEPCCNLLVAVDFYQRLGLSTLTLTYQRAMLRSFINEGGACVECPGCGRIVLLGAARPDAGPCRHCDRRFCSQCFLEPHGPLTCAERRTWAKIIEESRQGPIGRWATRLRNFLNVDTDVTARRCPNPQCGTMTQKVEGCLFLGCPRCKEMWCWSCGEWGGGPSGRPRPHHVFVCTQLPSEPTWLDGHASLVGDDARLDFYRQIWDSRTVATVAGSSDASNASEQLELATAAAEASAVLRHGAAWRFFERDEARRRLFEFAEVDLERLLRQFAEYDQAATWPQQAQQPSETSGYRRQQAAADRRQQALALTSALKAQATALRSYRHVGGV